MKKNRHIGSTFSSYLADSGLAGQTEIVAIKRVIVWQIEQAMKAARISKVEMSRRMRTSRAQLDRLLDPDRFDVRLETIQRAASAVGKKLHIEFS
ncbi:MAG: XRE family transcriptional regulator [Rhodospirillales bacterium]|nr:XRE family transcriptional regulator [Rhodospirillales bacterium]